MFGLIFLLNLKVSYYIIRRQIILILFIFLFLSNNSLCSFVKEIIESVKVIKVNSIEQNIDDFNIVTLSGDVEIFIDNNLHIWADKVNIDKEKKLLVAKKMDTGLFQTGAVVIESQDLFILADQFSFDLNKKTALVKNIRVHVSEGYILANEAKKVDEDRWIMNNIVFTPCDAHVPHWSIYAKSAVLYKNYLVKIAGILFKAGEVPFFALPYMVLPLQKRSESGFLLPKLSYDNDLGFGIRQEFYWSIAPRCDSTIGVDWRENKGLAFIDEFRWARSEESFTLINLRYALEKDAFVKKKDRIEKDTDKRYWIDGRDYRRFKKLSGKKIHSLLRVDFGSDKKIGYQFFDNFLRVDDTFYNSAILRCINNYDVLTFYFDSNQTTKSKFINLSDFEQKDILRILPDEEKEYIDSSQKEIEDKVTVFVLPHFEWNNVFHKIGKKVLFRQDFFLDHVFSREKKQDKYYVNSKVIKEGDLFSLDKVDSFRLFHNTDLQAYMKLKDQAFLFYLDSNFQIRTNLKDRSLKAKTNVLEGSFFDGGAYRFFLNGGAQWIMSELFFEQNNNNYYYLQPSFKWDFLPKFKQDHWYYSDKWDRFYPTNKLEFNLKNNWCVDDVLIDLNISQGIDFYNKEDRFYLNRCPSQQHLLPLDIELSVDCDVVDLFFKQEYEWKNLQLLSTQFNLSFNLKDFKFYFATVYQHEKLQGVRGLFSDISNFLILSLTVPLVKNAKLYYEGQFYSHKKSSLFPFEKLRPLRHAIRIDYEGHCWGISLGYEEKRYKEYGNWKSDKAYTLFIKLESLGSFAKKFKKPDIINRS